MSRVMLSGEFIRGAKGSLFVLLRRPASSARGCVLVVPPFAEEMNKCRRMITEVALELADDRVATVIPDLYGTGDSEGDFADADWATWLADLAATTRWTASRGCPVTSLLAVRLGCALAAEAVAEGGMPSVRRTVLWQPVFDGARFLNQFLRLRIAAGLMDDRKESLAELRTAFKAGKTIEVAGYGVSSRLAADVDTVAAPHRLPEALGEVAWLEVVREQDVPLPPASVRIIEQTHSRGGAIDTFGLLGEPFWSSTEIVVNRAFVQRTISHLSGREQAEGP